MFSKFAQNVFGNKQLMRVIRQAMIEERFAETACEERGQQNVRIEDDFHEAIRKTSSSVRIPACSARGRSFSRTCRSCSAAM